VRHLRLISIAMTALGIAVAAAAIAFDLGPLATLVGLMLAVAGIVKVATVAIWNGFFGLGPVKTHDD